VSLARYSLLKGGAWRMPLPPNTLAELQRDMARLGLVVSQIRQIEG